MMKFKHLPVVPPGIFGQHVAPLSYPVAAAAAAATTPTVRLLGRSFALSNLDHGMAELGLMQEKRELCSRLEADLRHKEGQLAAAQQQCDGCMRQIKQLDSQLSRTSAELAAVKVDVNTTTAGLRWARGQLQRERTAAQEKEAQLQAKVEQLCIEVTAAASAAAEAQGQLAQLQEQHRQLQASAQKQQEKAEQLQAATEQRLSEATATVHSHGLALMASQGEVERLSLKLAQVTTARNALTVVGISDSKDMEHMQKQVATANAAIIGLTGQLVAAKAELSKQREASQASSKQQQQELQQARREASAAQMDATHLRGQVEEATSAAAAERGAHAATRQQLEGLQGYHQQLAVEAGQLREAADGHEEDRQAWSQEQRRLKQKVMQARGSESAATAALGAAKQALQLEQSARAAAQDRISQLEMQLQLLTVANSSMKGQLVDAGTTLQKEVSASAAQHKQLEGRVAAAEQKAAVAVKEREEAVQQAAAVKAAAAEEVGALRAVVQKRDGQLASCQQQQKEQAAALKDAQQQLAVLQRREEGRPRLSRDSVQEEDQVVPPSSPHCPMVVQERVVAASSPPQAVVVVAGESAAMMQQQDKTERETQWVSAQAASLNQLIDSALAWGVTTGQTMACWQGMMQQQQELQQLLLWAQPPLPPGPCPADR